MNAISNFFITLFESFGLYSDANGLGDHLRGLDVQCTDYINQSTYNIIFICLFVINSIIMVNYYYGFHNRPKFSKFLPWFIHALIGAIILFLIAFFYSYNDFSTGNYCKDLNITTSDCIGFGSVAAIYSLIWNFIISIFLKLKSSNNKKVPY